MLTGDKLETAENIGYSCHLFSQRTTVFRLKSESIFATREQMRNATDFVKTKRGLRQKIGEEENWVALPFSDVADNERDEFRDIKEAVEEGTKGHHIEGLGEVLERCRLDLEHKEAYGLVIEGHTF